MDLLSSVNQIITGQQSALLAGIIAALTPCTLAMMPIVLYRFGVRGDKKFGRNIANLAFLVATFVISFLLAAQVLRNVLNGPLVNISRLGLGFGLVYAAFLTWRGTGLNSVFSRFTSPVAIGLALPWAIGLSPCVLPWLALSTLTTTNYSAVILFAVGLIAPAVFLAFLGSSALNASRKIGSIAAKAEVVAPFLLILSGCYLMLQLLGPTTTDVQVTFLVILAAYLFQTRQILKTRALRTMYNFGFMLLAATVVLVGFLTATSVASPANEALSFFEVQRFCIPGQDAQYRDQSTKLTAIYTGVASTLGAWLLTQERTSRRLIVNFRTEGRQD